MKKITPEEFEHLPLRGSGRASVFYRAIIGLLPGEALFIGREEYTLSYGPGRICRSIEKRFPRVKYSYGALADGSGWAVRREQ